ncbi:DUF4236 domain-containing protein [Ramlibacter humi]|uniref:DUF4236 domain-containing protein n=1 Tax=Ramlibacter humi TaxID=2530451 RepID=A0A4Z0CBA5_9BURK|nr:DUF4236 domain-containing protein [Ramlibacter humi]TFZ08947.1 DUF4236 domain-containing protein [Ramlibacter humi]
MGLTFSKSVRFGAVRFNISGSGIGMSVGIPGLRIGTGPRGAYISGGVGGFRYRRSLNDARRAQPARLQPQPALPGHSQAEPSPIIISTQEHDTLNVLELTDSDSDGLLQSMNEQRRKTPLWPFVAGALFLLWFPLTSATKTWPGFVHLCIAAVFAAVVGWVYWRDKMRKLTVLFFEPDAATSEYFDALTQALSSAASMRKVRAVVSTSQYADRKYSAGASEGLRFSGASLQLGQGPGVMANVQVPVLKTGRTTLAFYPDRVLAFQGNSVGAVSYDTLVAQEERSRFIESEAVPSDANVIDHTWQYVNRNGGPDRRFKNNRQLPICAYSQLNLSTPSGLDIRLLGSRERGFAPLAGALAQMA